VCFFLQHLSETFPIPSRTDRYMIINVHRVSCNLPVTLVRFYRNLNLLGRFSKITQISNSMKIRPVGTELFHADGRTDMAKLIVDLRNFAKAPKTV
jgi:hypothetical protein